MLNLKDKMTLQSHFIIVWKNHFVKCDSAILKKEKSPL